MDYVQICQLFPDPPAETAAGTAAPDEQGEGELAPPPQEFLALDGVEVWSDLGWTPIKYVMRHRTTKKAYRVLTHTGLVDVTEDHSLLREDGSEARGAEVFDIFERNIALKAAAEAEVAAQVAAGANPTTVKHQRKRGASGKIDRAASWWGEIPNRLLHRDLPPAVTHFDVPPSRAWVMGFFYAEGTCGSYIRKDSGYRCNSWAISNQDQEFLLKAQAILTEMEPDYTFVIDRCMASSACDKLAARGGAKNTPLFPLVDKWRRMFYTGDCNGDDSLMKYKKVPVEILNANQAARQAFFDGYWAGDGSKTGPGRKFDNKGHVGAAGLNFIAASLGIQVSLNIRENKPDVVLSTLCPANVKQRYDSNQVKKVVELPQTDGYVYDLETANHHFAAGVGRLVVHNSCMVALPPDLVRSRKECVEWGHRLSDEISGNPKLGIPGLFPPPLRMEFEKAMLLLNFTKKRYAALLIGKDGEYKRVEKYGPDGVLRKTDEFEMLKKGIVPARRDNCLFLRGTYVRILEAILGRRPYREAMEILVGAIHELLAGRVELRDLIVTKELNSDYKIDTCQMAVFAAELKRAGKLVSPGDRLEYIVVEGQERLIGQRMRLPEQYYEALDAGEDVRIDVMYYVEKAMQNPLDQLLSVGYRADIARLAGFGFKPPKARKTRTLETPVELIVCFLRAGFGLDQFWEKFENALACADRLEAAARAPARSRIVARLPSARAPPAASSPPPPAPR